MNLEGNLSQRPPEHPPGAGGFPPGYGGAPPGTSGPQAAWGNAQPPAGLAPPPKSKQVLLLVGIGCGLFLLIAVAAVVAGVVWLKSSANSAVSDLEKLRSAASAMASAGPGAPGAVAKDLTGDCLLAYQCCRTIATKTTSSAAAADACELFKTAGYPQATCSVTLTGYRRTAELAGARCD